MISSHTFIYSLPSSLGRSSREVLGGGEHDDGAAELDGHLHLLADPRPVRQQHPGTRLLRGARPRFQLSQIRQPGAAHDSIVIQYS